MKPSRTAAVASAAHDDFLDAGHKVRALGGGGPPQGSVCRANARNGEEIPA